MFRIVALLTSAAFLAACVWATAFRPAAERFGSSEQAIKAGRYGVTFSGNSRTSRDTVETYLLLRAAEVTLSQSKDWFRITNRDPEAKTRCRSHLSRFGRLGFRRLNRVFFSADDVAEGRPIACYEAFAD